MYIGRAACHVMFWVPFSTIWGSYFIAAYAGYVEWCIPVIDGCTSISKVGRQGVAFYLYKTLIIPSMFLIATFWIYVHKTIYHSRYMLGISISLCIFLVIYLYALGFDGAVYRAMRRIGVIVFFIGMPIAQIWLILATRKHVTGRLKTLLYMFIYAYLVIVVGYFYVRSSLHNRELENVMEWITALLIFSFFSLFSYAHPAYKKRLPCPL